MDVLEAKAHDRSQMIAMLLIGFGVVTAFVGCYSKFEAVTAAGGAIWGAGINQITANSRSTQNNRSGPTVNVDAAPVGA